MRINVEVHVINVPVGSKLLALHGLVEQMVSCLNPPNEQHVVNYQIQTEDSTHWQGYELKDPGAAELQLLFKRYPTLFAQPPCSMTVEQFGALKEALDTDEDWPRWTLHPTYSDDPDYVMWLQGRHIAAIDLEAEAGRLTLLGYDRTPTQNIIAARFVSTEQIRPYLSRIGFELQEYFPAGDPSLPLPVRWKTCDKTQKAQLAAEVLKEHHGQLHGAAEAIGVSRQRFSTVLKSLDDGNDDVAANEDPPTVDWNAPFGTSRKKG